jgi:ABC-type phosphate/phosphonate transport system permease subunit
MAWTRRRFFGTLLAAAAALPFLRFARPKKHKIWINHY